MQNNQPQYTEVKFGKEANDKLMEGIDEVGEAVATTLGPLGMNVAIDKGHETLVIHDGVRVAESINPKDPFKRLGAKILQEAAKKQRDEVGDGTTVVTILTRAILSKILEMKAAGINPMLIRRELEQGRDKITKALKKKSLPIKTLEQKIQIATISAEDPELGKMIAETIDKTGNEGVITVEESKANETLIEHQEGMQVDKGFAHYMMMTDIERQMAVLEDAYILVTDIPLTNLADIGKFLDSQVFPNTKKCLIISPEIGGDLLSVLVGAKMSGQFLGLAMRAPGIGSQQTEILQDICALTGATFVTKEAGQKLNDMAFSVLGKIGSVKMTKTSTILANGGGHRDDILLRIQGIRGQLEDDTLSDFEKEQLQARLAKLTNGVAVIKVGGQTAVEMKERKERAIDAVCATQAASRYGLIAGGETAYLSVLSKLNTKILGEKILFDALKQPFKRLVSNAGYDAGKTLAELDNYGYGHGFDVIDGKFKDMIESGIVDPVSVATSAVKISVSVSIQLGSLGAAIITQDPEVK